METQGGKRTRGVHACRAAAAGKRHETQARHRRLRGGGVVACGTCCQAWLLPSCPAHLGVESVFVAQCGVAGQHLIDHHHLHGRKRKTHRWCSSLKRRVHGQRVARGAPALLCLRRATRGAGCTPGCSTTCSTTRGTSCSTTCGAHLLVWELFPRVQQLVQQLDGSLPPKLAAVLALKVGLCRRT